MARKKLLERALTIRFPAELLETVEKFSAQLGISTGTFIRQLVSQALPTMVRTHQALREAAEGDIRSALSKLDKEREVLARQMEMSFPKGKGRRKKNR